MKTGGPAIAAPASTPESLFVPAARRRSVALVGNPNCGKTTLFNALTGLRQKVGNYPGVTVERKVGTVAVPGGSPADLVDLPGLYSLTPHSPDEQIARDVLLGYRSDTPQPDYIINVVDATNLERNLFLTSQLLDLGVPVVVALTMVDSTRRSGREVDAGALSDELGVPVIPVIAAKRVGTNDLLQAVLSTDSTTPPGGRRWTMPAKAEAEVTEMAQLLQKHHGLGPQTAFAEATLLLSLPESHVGGRQRWSDPILEHLRGDHETLSASSIDFGSALAEARYAAVGDIVQSVQHRPMSPPSHTLSERLDRVFMHRFWGYVIFLALMVGMFQAMFTWAVIPQGWIQSGVDAVKALTVEHFPAGDLRDLFVEGVLGGVGNSLAFLPQILLLFCFISTLEDTGYLARAAFLMDRLMSRVGLHGKSFIPLLSSYACAIPGIMATRTIDSPRARLLTILVAPLMSCSARLPVYALMIGAFIPPTLVVGFHLGHAAIGLTLPALTLFGMYALGTTMAFALAALFNRTLLQGSPPTFLLEMPPYRTPSLKTVAYQMFERAGLFLRRAGSVILCVSVVLWFLASYPKVPGASPSTQLRSSFAGHIGRVIEPVIRPLGFDWKMGIGIISSFAAREVFVTAMGTVYNVEAGSARNDAGLSVALGQRLRDDVDEQTGKPAFTPLVAVCLMVYYVLAMQCMSTVAVVRRETNGWRWPLFQIAYMTVLAWVVTFAVYQGGHALGLG